MYKRRNGQVSMLENPEMFGSLPLNPENEWIKLAGLIPWREFERKYAENFRSKKGQRACDARMALGALIIKQRYKLSDEDMVAEIAMNPYLQYFLGLKEYRYETPFDPSMFTRFRQRISPEMLAWVNDEIIEAKKEKESIDDHKDDDDQDKLNGEGDGTGGAPDEPEHEGTLILDATCAPQNIRFPTDVSLVSEARENAEEIIDRLHEANLTDGQKPRTYRENARKAYNSFSKSRKKTFKKIRKALGQQLRFLRRDLRFLSEIEARHPDCKKVLPKWLQERWEVIHELYRQQQHMFKAGTHQVDHRIVSLSQPWIRPIKRGKQTADVEFGAKVEMSVVNGFLRVEEIRWEAFNESTTLQDSVEDYRKRYGHYPERVLADTIFRNRENMRYCKEKGIHMNGPKLGKPMADPVLRKEQKRLEWLESAERGEIERCFGVCKRRYSLGKVMTKLKNTSETVIQASVLVQNLWKRLRLLLRNFGTVPKSGL